MSINLQYNNLTDINKNKIEYIKSSISYFLKLALKGKDYSEFLHTVDIIEDGDDSLNFRFLEGRAGYDRYNKKIVLTNIKNYKELDLCIYHEVSHLNFTINNQIRLENLLQEIGYEFLNEYYAFYEPVSYNLNLKSNEEWVLSIIKNEVKNYTNIIRMLKNRCDDMNDIIRDIELDEELQDKVNSYYENIENTKYYLLARSVASVNINLQKLNISIFGDEYFDNIISYINNEIDFKNINNKNCEEIGKLIKRIY
ncbi:hypothetical protein [Clostridium sp.]|uniref:hypothetical protein n=1 Tax=Clostridium sp. TaxID=1506 RepID=UPI001DB1E8F6|nr:hypothetical protein [Clostridium sp.]MBS5937742.1 hypothetical protein [Clostridium sp.]